MRRKYGDKNATWMKKRYYRHLKAFGINNRWVFTDPKTGIFLMQLKWTGIQRHIMIKNNACPDDPNKIEYFKTRRGLNIERNINPFSVLQKSLAISQDHICPLCNTSLYNGEKLHRHHIVAYADGGPTTFNNLVLIHLPCHNKITFDKRPERREETKEWLLIYKQNHPNRLTAYLKKLKSNVIPENNSVDFLD
jgi:RNA-directed DNA polymerase